ncbi:MAG: hypothetical protein RBR78_06355, partial [Flavobacteriaceae bacterium]|nr:hypothetical protein [Flavobacteriaceae bacterium]
MKSNYLIKLRFIVLLLLCWSSSNLLAQIKFAEINSGEPLPPITTEINENQRTFFNNLFCIDIYLSKNSNTLFTLNPNQNSFLNIKELPGSDKGQYLNEYSSFVLNEDNSAFLVGKIVHSNDKSLAWNYTIWLKKDLTPSNNESETFLLNSLAPNIDRRKLESYSIDHTKDNQLNGLNLYEGTVLRIEKESLKNKIFVSNQKDNTDLLLSNIGFSGDLIYKGVNSGRISISGFGGHFGFNPFICLPNPCKYTIYRICFYIVNGCYIGVYQQIITVNDTTPPTFNEELPANITVACDNIPQAQTLTASDNNGNATVSFKEVVSESGDACSYNIYRIWTAEDACGNITVHKQTITVQDTTAPTFNEELPANATVECDNIPQA